MTTTLNTVATINGIRGNNLIVEVMPNTVSDNSLQFYYLDQSGNTITNYFDFNESIRDAIKRNRLIYITFCGISNKDKSVPEYLYMTFHGADVISYAGKQNRNQVILNFNFRKIGLSIENELKNLFTDNIGVFIQAYL
jgi:hypothetical protein